MPTEFTIVGWTWWVIQLCVLPPALLIGLFTGNEIPAAKEVFDCFRSNGKFGGPFGEGPLPIKILFGIPVSFFAVILYLPMVVGVYAATCIGMLRGGDSPDLAWWMIFILPGAFWVGVWSAGKVLNRLDEWLGLNPMLGFSSMWHAFIIAGGVYIGIKAVKASKSIITKI